MKTQGEVSVEIVKVNDTVPNHDASGYSILEQPMGTKKQVRIVVMGAGASTLCFLKRAQDRLQNVDIVVYEKNSDIGGTWLENRYPGAACDIPSVNYQFTWKPHLWTHFYSYSREIWQYLKDISDEHNFVQKYIRLRHQVVRAEWDDNEGLWEVQVKDLATGVITKDTAHFFLNAGGILNDYKWPAIPGLRSFQGKLLHSAAYEEGLSLEGKRVAVLGAGSTGVQIVPAIQPKVDHLFHLVRSPIWIVPGFGRAWASRSGANFKFSEEQLQYLEQNPKKALEYAKQIETDLSKGFKSIINGTTDANEVRDATAKQMKLKLKYDPELCDKIIPKDFNPGCRRPTPAPGYLEALTASNVTVLTEDIRGVTPKGFLDHDGNEIEVEVIICATGFDTSWLPRFPLIAHGRDLREIWAGEGDITGYLAIGVPDFPNHFTFRGPYGPFGHGSFMPLVERWTEYILDIIDKVQVEHIKSIAPNMETTLKFRQHADLFVKRTAWSSPCRSWFKQGKIDGQVAVYPGSRIHYLELLKAPRFEDFDITHDHANNPFAFLGNGTSLREFDGRDVTKYLGCLNEHGEDIQPVFGSELVAKMAGWSLDKSCEVRASSLI